MDFNNNAFNGNNGPENNGNSYRADNQGQQFSDSPYFSSINNGVNNKKKSNKLAIAAIIVGGVAILLLLIFGGYNFLKNFGLGGTNPGGNDLGDESMSIIQNAPQVEINQSTDTDYVPQSLPEVVNKVAASVVEISTSSIQKDYFYGQYVTSGAGSGVIVTQSSEAGYLLTNYHVVYEEEGKLVDTITVVLTNGESYEASLIGSDQGLDLALIRIEKKKGETFTVASFGKSSNLVVGQQVIAIGNPLGSLGGTVTDGIISALDREVEVGNVEMVLLQHSAAINPGNSGGALFDMMGNLIGIVNAKTSDTGIEGLGFAIPSDIAFAFLNRVLVIEPAMGIRVQYGRLNNVLGVYVVETINSSFKQYDRVLKVNGTAVANAKEYYAIIDTLKIGDTVTLTVRRGGADKDIKINLQK
jgi:serine protease Do